MKDTLRRHLLLCARTLRPPMPLPAPTSARSVHSSTSSTAHRASPAGHSDPPDATFEQLRAEKAQLRKRLKAQLSALPPAQLLTESQQATRLLLTHPVLSPLLAASPAVALYLSMASAEFQTRPLLAHLFSAGKRVFLPRVLSAGRMALLECHSLADVDSLPANGWGIREPALTDGRCSALQCVEQVGLCVVPGVAFTRDGLRLGHGKGYYDRYLSEWDEARQKRGLAGAVPTVALALRCQLVEQLPVMEHDRRIDHVIHAPHDGEGNG